MTQEHQPPKKRVRIEVATSTKGVHTYSCTVEIVEEATVDIPNDLCAAVLAESDWLVAELDRRYPAPEVG